MSGHNSIDPDEIEWNMDDKSGSFLGLSDEEIDEVSSTVTEFMEETDGFPETTKRILEEPGLSAAQKVSGLLAIGHGSLVSTRDIVELLCDRVARTHKEEGNKRGLSYAKFVVKGIIKDYPREVQIAILEDVKSMLTEGFREEVKDIVKKRERERRRDSTVF